MSGPSYRVPYRRRRKGKTDFHARRALVLSRIPRLVARGSLRYMMVQIVEAQPQGDKIIASAYSRELNKTYDWRGCSGNLPSAYLTGFLCGLRAAAKGVKKAILDIGLHPPTKGSRIFAALKGVMDAGVEVPCDKEKLPDDKRITGQHIVDYAKQLASSEQETYQNQFSRYLTEKLLPEELPEHFSQVKEKIEESFKPSAEKKEKPKVKKAEKEVPEKAKPKKVKAKAKAKAKPKTAKKPRKAKEKKE